MYIKDKNNQTIELLPSRAIGYNRNSDKAAYLIPYGGTPDNPEFLYPEELEAAVAIASAKEAKQKAIEKEVAKLNSSDAWKYVGRRQGENFEANQHAREYVEPIVDAAVGGIGTAMAMANPVTTELAIDALRKLGHAGHVVINPLAAETMFGAALGTAGNAWLTAGGLYRNSELINKWIGPDGRPFSGDGSFNWSDLPEFGLNLLGVTPTAGVMARTFDKASDVYNTYKTSQAISKANKAVSKARAEKIKEFGPDWGGNVNAPRNAESIDFTQSDAIHNKQITGQLSSKNPSKLTEGELAGKTRHERTNVVNVRKPIKVNSSLPNHDRVLKALDRDVPLLDRGYFSALDIDFDLIRNNLVKNGYPEAAHLTNDQIHKLISVRQYDIINGINNPNIYAIRTPYITNNGSNIQLPEYKSYTGNRNTGFIGVVPNDPVGYNKVGMIQNLTKGTEEPIKGVGEILYNVALKDMPIRTGDYVLDGKAIPAITSKFKRELIENTGKHIIDGENFYNQPVYNLLEPTFDVPYKFIDDFTLDNLDDNGSFIVDFIKGPMYKEGGKIDLPTAIDYLKYFNYNLAK